MCYQSTLLLLEHTGSKMTGALFPRPISSIVDMDGKNNALTKMG